LRKSRGGYFFVLPSFFTNAITTNPKVSIIIIASKIDIGTTTLSVWISSNPPFRFGKPAKKLSPYALQVRSYYTAALAKSKIIRNTARLTAP